jgi:glycerol-3-phosphate acyltransferase PlsY
MLIKLAVLIGAYLLGSIPTALIYSRWRSGQDIRLQGDGNMGARNTKHIYGWKAGIFVASMDMLKGWLAVVLANLAGLSIYWMLAAAAAVILGHDFPVFARFKGGQGFAATSGAFIGLFPIPGLIALFLYTSLYVITRNSDLAAGIAMAYLVGAVWYFQREVVIVAALIILLLFVPFKKWLDRHRLDQVTALENGKGHSA